MLKILHIVPDIDGGGVGSVVYNYLSNMNREDMHIDVAVRDYGYKQFLHDNFIKCGINIIYVTQKNKKLLQHFKEINELMKNNHYDIVHCHDQNWSYFYLKLAKNNGVPVRIAHSHLTMQKNDRIKIKILNLFTPALKKIATGYFACGVDAGAYMWGEEIAHSKRLYLMKNAINLGRFQFNKSVRNEYRKQFDWEDNIVIGHVGRFNEQKNHKFLIEIFKAYHENNVNSKLVLVGQGELENEIRIQVEEYNLSQSVLFLGIRNDVPELMNAFDIFLFPSLYEGLPVVGLEAQASGLPCLFSNTITKEVILSDKTHVMKLSEKPENWAQEIEKMGFCSDLEREDAHVLVNEKGYNICVEAEKLRQYYFNSVYDAK